MEKFSVVKMPIEEGHLFGCGRLECLAPAIQCSSFYGWILHAPALYPFEQDIRRGRAIVQLNCGAQSAGSQPQGIPLGPCPGSPFDDYDEIEREELLSKLPLQRLDFSASYFVVNV